MMNFEMDPKDFSFYKLSVDGSEELLSSIQLQHQELDSPQFADFCNSVVEEKLSVEEMQQVGLLEQESVPQLQSLDIPSKNEDYEYFQGIEEVQNEQIINIEQYKFDLDCIAREANESTKKSSDSMNHSNKDLHKLAFNCFVDQEQPAFEICQEQESYIQKHENFNQLDCDDLLSVPKELNNEVCSSHEYVGECDMLKIEKSDEEQTNSTKNFSKAHSSSKSVTNINEDEKKELLRSRIAAITQTSKDKNVDLAQRRDVVNKTVLRVLRRYYTQLFKQMFPKKFKSKEAKSKWYFDYIKLFCENVFGVNHECLSEIQFFMASIINPSHMTRQDIVETGLSQDAFETFHSCLYKYSHSKLVSLLEIKPLVFIYDTFYNGSLDEILRSEPSVCKNYETYKVAFREFYEILQDAADVATYTLN